MSDSNPTLKLYGNLRSADERMREERGPRIQNGSQRLTFGVGFLDDAFGGIYPNDLILLGAKTGFGKTQLVTLMAMHSARMGKRVHFFALEAENYEIERRLKYQRLSDLFYADPNRPRIYLNYMDWYYGLFDQELAPYEEQIQAEGSLCPGLKTYYRDGDFTAETFERLFLGIKDQTDLVIIDHLHYFDSDDENENRALKNIVKKIRDCALIAGKPIILVAHIRKSDRKQKQLIPSLEDFHGSSDIGKICTKAVTIAPCFNGQDKKQRPTYFQILKCRADGTRTSTVGLCAYNFSSQRYEQNYFIGRVNETDNEFTAFGANEIPFWAKKSRLP